MSIRDIGGVKQTPVLPPEIGSQTIKETSVVRTIQPKSGVLIDKHESGSLPQDTDTGFVPQFVEVDVPIESAVKVASFSGFMEEVGSTMEDLHKMVVEDFDTVLVEEDSADAEESAAFRAAGTEYAKQASETDDEGGVDEELSIGVEGSSSEEAVEGESTMVLSSAESSSSSSGVEGGEDPSGSDLNTASSRGQAQLATTLSSMLGVNVEEIDSVLGSSDVQSAGAFRDISDYLSSVMQITRKVAQVTKIVMADMAKLVESLNETSTDTALQTSKKQEEKYIENKQKLLESAKKSGWVNMLIGGIMLLCAAIAAAVLTVCSVFCPAAMVVAVVIIAITVVDACVRFGGGAAAYSNPQGVVDGSNQAVIKMLAGGVFGAMTADKDDIPMVTMVMSILMAVLSLGTGIGGLSSAASSAGASIAKVVAASFDVVNGIVSVAGSAAQLGIMATDNGDPGWAQAGAMGIMGLAVHGMMEIPGVREYLEENLGEMGTQIFEMLLSVVASIAVSVTISKATSSSGASAAEKTSTTFKQKLTQLKEKVASMLKSLAKNAKNLSTSVSRSMSSVSVFIRSLVKMVDKLCQKIQSLTLKTMDSLKKFVTELKKFDKKFAEMMDKVKTSLKNAKHITKADVFDATFNTIPEMMRTMIGFMMAFVTVGLAQDSIITAEARKTLAENNGYIESYNLLQNIYNGESNGDGTGKGVFQKLSSSYTDVIKKLSSNIDDNQKMIRDLITGMVDAVNDLSSVEIA